MTNDFDHTVPGKPGDVVATGGRRCGVERSVWLDDWYVSHSPRNDNSNAEGPWSDWVALAREIIALEDARNTTQEQKP